MTTPVTKDRYAALITRATSGIGLELARVLAADGHPMVIVARDSERLQTAAAELQSEYDVPVSWYAKDLAEPGAADGLWMELSNANITVDVLVNNAGVGVYGELQNEALDQDLV